MSKVFIEDTTLTAIGDAIREKNGTTELIPPLNMGQAIKDLSTGGGENRVIFTHQQYGESTSGYRKTQHLEIDISNYKKCHIKVSNLLTSTQYENYSARMSLGKILEKDSYNNLQEVNNPEETATPVIKDFWKVEYDYRGYGGYIGGDISGGEFDIDVSQYKRCVVSSSMYGIKSTYDHPSGTMLIEFIFS